MFTAFVLSVITLLLVFASLYLMKLLMNKPWGFRALFVNFKQKIWMTAGLGLFFCGLYLTLLMLCSKVSSTTKGQIFLSMQNEPTRFIYLGLLIFLSVSVTICLIRSCIKRLYNKRYK